MQKTFKYTNGEVTIVWKPDTCIHSTLCWKGLREVFDPTRRPWIKPEAAVTDKIIAQVRQCPSGALSYFMNGSEDAVPATAATEAPKRDPIAESAHVTNIELRPNGPIVVNNECLIKHSDGREETRSAKVFLCRCGASANKPFCDGTHKKIGFEG
jgi:uncharacterized Fe-S cluster protein YjdI